jgi:hypothetical protein
MGVVLPSGASVFPSPRGVAVRPGKGGGTLERTEGSTTGAGFAWHVTGVFSGSAMGRSPEPGFGPK